MNNPESQYYRFYDLLSSLVFFCMVDVSSYCFLTVRGIASFRQEHPHKYTAFWFQLHWLVIYRNVNLYHADESRSPLEGWLASTVFFSQLFKLLTNRSLSKSPLETIRFIALSRSDATASVSVVIQMHRDNRLTTKLDCYATTCLPEGVSVIHNLPQVLQWCCSWSDLQQIQSAETPNHEVNWTIRLCTCWERLNVLQTIFIDMNSLLSHRCRMAAFGEVLGSLSQKHSLLEWL